MVKIKCKKCGKIGFSATSAVKCICGGACAEVDAAASGKEFTEK